MSSCNRHGMRQKPPSLQHAATHQPGDIQVWLSLCKPTQQPSQIQRWFLSFFFFSLNTIRPVQCYGPAVTFASVPCCAWFSLLTHILMGSSCVNTWGLVPPYETKDDVSHFGTVCVLIVLLYTWPISWSSCSCRAVRSGVGFPVETNGFVFPIMIWVRGRWVLVCFTVNFINIAEAS